MNSKFNFRFSIALLIFMMILSGCTQIRATSQPKATPTLFQPLASIAPSSTPIVPEATPTVSVTPTLKNLPLVLPAADDASKRLSVPDGFAIRIFAQNLTGNPRFMTFGPDNVLYLSLTGAGEVVRLPDVNHDGLADSTEVILSGLNQPHGLEWHDGWLYVAENDRIERFQSSKSDGTFDARELVTNNIPGGNGHFTRTIHFGPDGKMYVSSGSSCNVCAESDPRRAAILRFNPDGSIPADNPFATDADVRKQAVWAWGLRNSVDFLWTPTGEMWANMNGRDDLLDATGSPDNLPPEAIVFSIGAGQFYGWPYCYSTVMGSNANSVPQTLDTQSGLTLPAGLDCNQAVPALFTDLPHSAPLGMTLGNIKNFPVEFQPDLFVAYHGSWNIQDPANIRDCKVVRIINDVGKPVRSEDFITGWRAPGKTCGDPSAYGRPVDVVFGPDGAMYISDDAGGRVYRVISTQ